MSLSVVQVTNRGKVGGGLEVSVMKLNTSVIG